MNFCSCGQCSKEMQRLFRLGRYIERNFPTEEEACLAFGVVAGVLVHRHGYHPLELAIIAQNLDRQRRGIPILLN